MLPYLHDRKMSDELGKSAVLKGMVPPRLMIVSDLDNTMVCSCLVFLAKNWLFLYSRRYSGALRHEMFSCYESRPGKSQSV